MSQALRPRSQKPSKRPAATQARSSAAAPKRRSPPTLGCSGRHLLRHVAKLPRPRCGMPLAITASSSFLRAGDAQALVVEEGALALLGQEQSSLAGIVDHAGDDLALALQGDGDREVRDAVQEVGGAVERIDDPGVGLVGALDLAALFAEEAVAGPRLGELARRWLPRPLVGGGDEIAGPLATPAGSRPRRSRGSARGRPCARRRS